MKAGENRQSKVFRYIKAIWTYGTSHMWCSFAAAILLSVFLLYFITMWYMKDRYYTNLIETTYSTERALLESVDKNIENQMEVYVSYGSRISIDLEVGRMIEKQETGEISASERKSMKNILKRTIKVSNSIIGIALASSDGILYQYDRLEMNVAGARSIWDEDSEEIIKETFVKVQEMAVGHAVPRYEIITQPLVHPNDSGLGLIHIAFPLKSNYSYEKMRYMLVLTFDGRPMSTLLKQLNQNQEEYIQAYIEDEKGKILLHTGGAECLGKKSDIYENGSRIIDLTADIGAFGWVLHAVIDGNILEEKVNEIYDRMVLIFVAAIVLIMFLLFIVTNRILKPVKVISSSISRVKEGDTREQLSIEGTNEIWQLAQEYNEMVRAIRKASQEVEEEHFRVIESMKMKQLAEREALESQINAHFICNTLNVINYEAIDSGNYKISVLLKKLSNILRYTFDQKHQNVYCRTTHCRIHKQQIKISMSK
ncbi:MAG: histidine kinase [Dorea sp.]|nr:histidine kinase [Dorea sp.]